MNWQGMAIVLAAAAGFVAFVLGSINPFFEEATQRRAMIIAFGICVVFTTIAVGLP